MKFQVFSLHGKWDKNSERNTQKLAPQQAAECWNATMISIRMLCACTRCIVVLTNFRIVFHKLRNMALNLRNVQNIILSRTSVDDAAVSILQSRSARLEHLLSCEQSFVIARIRVTRLLHP